VPLLTDASAVRDLYQEARDRGFLIPGIGAENRETLECCFTAARRLGAEIGVPEIPLCIGITGRYAGRSQLRRYTTLGDELESLRAVRDDLLRLLRPDGPFAQLRVHLHLDHGQPDLDQDLFDEGRGTYGSVMFDASALPLAENRALTRRFVEEWGSVYMVEGAVDELPAAGEEAPGDDLTKPEDVRRFLEDTGVDLVVVNVGTEHRATTERAHYHQDRAAAIGKVAGGRMVLHGTSSLGGRPVGSVRDDGFIRFNMWTALETVGGQALARDTIANTVRILPPEAVQRLVADGMLGLAIGHADGALLEYVTNDHRRDRVWAPAVTDFLVAVLRECRYERVPPTSP
jgi:fructose-bisphosphate aldolase class II